MITYELSDQAIDAPTRTGVKAAASVFGREASTQILNLDEFNFECFEKEYL